MFIFHYVILKYMKNYKTAIYLLLFILCMYIYSYILILYVEKTNQENMFISKCEKRSGKIGVINNILFCEG